MCSSPLHCGYPWWLQSMRYQVPMLLAADVFPTPVRDLRTHMPPEYGDCEATRLSARKGSVSQQVTTVGRKMVQLTESWRSRDEGGSWVSTIQPYQTWEFREMNVILDQISIQCFTRTNKVLLSTSPERIHTSTQLPDLNGASTRWWCVRCLLITESPETPSHYRYQI